MTCKCRGAMCNALKSRQTQPANSTMLFVAFTIHSFKRNFLENLSRRQNSPAKPALIGDVDPVSKRKRWGWFHRTPLHRLLVRAHKSRVLFRAYRASHPSQETSESPSRTWQGRFEGAREGSTPIQRRLWQAIGACLQGTPST
jgi:hypothetical protein